jgi:SAM-dependent methyltransferase
MRQAARTSLNNPAIPRHRWWVLPAAVAGLLSALVLWYRRSFDPLRWNRVVYPLAYRLGLVGWQRPAPPADLVALVEGPGALPPGRALDLGCGTGTDTCYLAAHGWEATGVDMVPRALATARGKAADAGVVPRFVEGDVTRLHEVGIGAGYSLLLDFGCLHSLPDDQRDAYIAGLSQAAAPGATFLLYGFRRNPPATRVRPGLTPEEVRSRFVPAGWRLVRVGPASVEGLGVALPKAVRWTVERRLQLWRYELERDST